MDDDLRSPADLLRNLQELVELDRWFGVTTLPRVEQPAGAEDEPIRQRIRRPQTPAPAQPAPQPELPPLDDLPRAGDPAAGLATIAERIAACERCGLCKKRSNTVPGEGSPTTELLFIGEGPGADEDRQGRPFVGPAGQLLDKMILAMGFARADVFIANIVKCRPPGNRTPEPEEAAACLPYLEAQVDLLKPSVICTLGNTPLRALKGDPKAGITRNRGTPFQWRGYTVIPTFHPSYLLRNAAGKKPAWEDLKQVLSVLGREPPAR